MAEHEFKQQLEKEFEKYQQENTILPNIMVLGKVGVGKSSLINLVFGRDVARVSNTIPETQDFVCYYGKDNNSNVNLIDSKGYEINIGIGKNENKFDTAKEAFDNYAAQISKYITSRQDDTMQRVHLVWYCIAVSEKKVEDLDKEVLRTLINIPELKNRIAVVFTKCDDDDINKTTINSFRDILKGYKLPMFETSNLADLPLELEDLVNWSAESLGEEDYDLMASFWASRKMDLEERKKKAQKIIAAAAATAAAIGVAPIPFADAPILTTAQVAMATNIIKIYGLSGFAEISASLVSSVVISNIGKSLAGSLLKLIPGVGTAVGGTINGTVAASITTALGLAVSQACYISCKQILNGETPAIEELFSYVNLKNLFLENKDKKLELSEDAFNEYE